MPSPRRSISSSTAEPSALAYAGGGASDTGGEPPATMCATDETAKLSGLGSKAYFPDIFVCHWGALATVVPKRAPG
jgi:hypothetical protein